MHPEMFRFRSRQAYICPENYINCSNDPQNVVCCPIDVSPSGYSDEGETSSGAASEPTATESSVMMETTAIVATTSTYTSQLGAGYSYGSATSVAGAESTPSPTDPPTTAQNTIADASDRFPTSVTASPSSLPSNTDEGLASNLPHPVIVGIGLGVSIAGLAGLLVTFFLARRYGLLSRWRSNQHGRGRQYDYAPEDKAVMATAPTRANHGSDVFAPFGGRNNSVESLSRRSTHLILQPTQAYSNLTPSPSRTDSPARSSLVSPLSTSDIRTSMHQDPTWDAVSLQRGNAEAGAQPESNTRYLKPCYDEAEMPGTLDSPGSTSSRDDTIYSLGSPIGDVLGLRAETISPAYSNVVLQDAKKQRMTRVKTGDAAVISVGSRGHKSRPASLNERIQLRATMNATSDDIEKNRHVNSWNHL